MGGRIHRSGQSSQRPIGCVVRSFKQHLHPLLLVLFSLCATGYFSTSFFVPVRRPSQRPPPHVRHYFWPARTVTKRGTRRLLHTFYSTYEQHLLILLVSPYSAYSGPFFLLAVQRPSQTGCRARTFRLRRAACFKPSWSRVVCVMCTATEKDASASLRRLLTQNLKRWTHAQSVTCKIAHVIYDVIGSAGRWCVCGGRRGAAAKGEDDDAGARRTDAERSMGQGRRCAAEQRRQQMRNDLGHKCCWARLRGCEVDGVGRRARRKR